MKPRTINQFLCNLAFTLRKTTNNICSNCHVCNIFKEIVSNLTKLLNCILSVHLLEDIVVACLDWNMDEAEDSWMSEEVTN